MPDYKLIKVFHCNWDPKGYAPPALSQGMKYVSNFPLVGNIFLDDVGADKQDY